MQIKYEKDGLELAPETAFEAGYLEATFMGAEVEKEVTVRSGVSLGDVVGLRVLAKQKPPQTENLSATKPHTCQCKEKTDNSRNEKEGVGEKSATSPMEKINTEKVDLLTCPTANLTFGKDFDSDDVCNACVPTRYDICGEAFRAEKQTVSGRTLKCPSNYVFGKDGGAYDECNSCQYCPMCLAKDE